jgi:hypothetical protein
VSVSGAQFVSNVVLYQFIIRELAPYTWAAKIV